VKGKFRKMGEGWMDFFLKNMDRRRNGGK